MTIRPAGPGDYGLVKGLHEAMSPDNLYFRFFGMNRAAAEQEARRVCREAGPDHGALLGLLGDELAGVASYEPIPGEGTAEVALAVADGMHGRGIATLLLEHTVSLARARGVRVLTAQVLPGNSAVLQVLGDAGLSVRRRSGNGVVELSMPVPQSTALGEDSAYLDAVAEPRRTCRCGKPGASAGSPVGRGGRRGQPPRIGWPEDSAQHPRRRFRRCPVCH